MRRTRRSVCFLSLTAALICLITNLYVTTLHKFRYNLGFQDNIIHRGRTSFLQHVSTDAIYTADHVSTSIASVFDDISLPTRTSSTVKVTTDDIVWSTTNQSTNQPIPFANFSYPLDVDMVKLVQDYKRDGHVKHQSINDFKLRYLYNPTKTCESAYHARRVHKGADVFLLFVVKSKSDHWRQRLAIRETWGNITYLNSVVIKTVFVLGVPLNGTLDLIYKELKQYNDIILMDFIDSYYNNTLKTSTSFNWIPNFCSHARFVALLDDDIYVSVKSLVNYLDNIPHNKRVQLYMGRVHYSAAPHRHIESKWCVPLSEYPWDRYPNFTTAGTVIMTMDFVSDVQIAMRYVKPYRLDDIYLAIIAYKLGVAPVPLTGVYDYRVSAGQREFSSVLTAHGYTPEQLRHTWTHKALQPRNKFNMVPNVKQALLPRTKFNMVPNVKQALIPRNTFNTEPNVKQALIQKTKSNIVPNVKQALIPRNIFNMVPNVKQALIPKNKFNMVPNVN